MNFLASPAIHDGADHCERDALAGLGIRAHARGFVSSCAVGQLTPGSMSNTETVTPLNSQTDVNVIEYPEFGFVPEVATSSVCFLKSINGTDCTGEGTPNESSLCTFKKATHSSCELIAM